MSHKNSKETVMEWLESNLPLLDSLYTPIANTEYNLISLYDDVFRDTIRENSLNMFYSLVCVEFSRSTGISTEEFYSVVEPKDLLSIVMMIEDLK